MVFVSLPYEWAFKNIFISGYACLNVDLTPRLEVTERRSRDTEVCGLVCAITSSTYSSTIEREKERQNKGKTMKSETIEIYAQPLIKLLNATSIRWTE